MYGGTLNIPTINPLHSCPQTSTGLLRSGQRRMVSPRAVAAVESARSSRSSLYEVLRLEPTATLTEIKTAYRSLAKVYHPDSAVASSDGLDFMEIHNAYETLSDPAARAVYDLSLVSYTNSRRTASFVYSGRGGFYPTRRWETDQCW